MLEGQTENTAVACAEGCGCGGSGGNAASETAARTSHGCGCGRHAPDAAPGAKQCACGGLARWRRLHSAVGAALVVFLLSHVMLASTAVSPRRFDAIAQAMHALKTQLPFVQPAILMLFALAAAAGVYLLTKAGLRFSVQRCNRGGKVRFFLQRISAVVVLGFLLAHVGAFTWWSRGPADSYQACREAVFGRAELPGVVGGLLPALYFVAVIAVGYHVGNGALTSWVLWRLPDTPVTRRFRLALSVVVGTAIAAAGMASLMGLQGP